MHPLDPDMPDDIADVCSDLESEIEELKTRYETLRALTLKYLLGPYWDLETYGELMDLVES